MNLNQDPGDYKVLASVEVLKYFEFEDLETFMTSDEAHPVRFDIVDDEGFIKVAETDIEGTATTDGFGSVEEAKAYVEDYVYNTDGFEENPSFNWIDNPTQ